ncbi:hypothetical protein E4U24_002568 [Claviceps purpurea]|nr:hypothetical protein E4U24_002568 [Claviceps purpurea]
MPLNPAFLGTTTAFSGSLDAFSVQSHHQPNMGDNSNFSFLDAQPDQFAAVATPEMENPFMPSTTPADAHAISDGSPTALQTHMWTTGYGSQLRQNQENHIKNEPEPDQDQTQTQIQLITTTWLMLTSLRQSSCQPPLLATVATREQKAFGAVGKAFEPKVTAAKAVFKKYLGSEMIRPRYSDKAKARAEKPGLFTGEISKFDSWCLHSTNEKGGFIHHQTLCPDSITN